MRTPKNRRDFIKFLGGSTLAAYASAGWLTACQSTTKNSKLRLNDFRFIPPSLEDDLLCMDGIKYRTLVSWGDSIHPSLPLKFGFNNDFISWLPYQGDNRSVWMWVNHESPNPLFVSGFQDRLADIKTREQATKEMQNVGGSILRAYQDSNNSWQVDVKHSGNKRLDAFTPIGFSQGASVQDKKVAIGTLANCAGGKTPWNTFLTCEENYDQYFGEWDYSPKPGEKKPRVYPKIVFDKEDFGWHNHYDHPSTHYGWVVEINPVSGEAKKQIGMGRFAHEGATVVVAADGRAVVYMGDDANDQCVYKYIADKPGSLEYGKLYVANIEKGQWLELNIKAHPDFSWRFKDQTDLLIQTRAAAHIIGGTKLDRPEDIEINPLNNDIIVALTNNKPKGRVHGSLLKIQETNSDFLSMTFKAETWISGGDDSTMSCPDNLAFDKSGNLWMTSDRSGKDIGTADYKSFGNNGLYFIPMHGPQVGQVFQVASAPKDAEFTGPCFSPDGESLFLSVQHPGELTKDLSKPTSRWPDKDVAYPKPSVVVIEGPMMKDLVNYKG